MTIKSLAFVALGAAVLGTGAFGLHLKTKGHTPANIDSERAALEKCLPGSKEMNIPDYVIHTNILLYKKTIEIANSTKNEIQRQENIKNWGETDYIKYINSFKNEEQNKIFELIKILRANDQAGSCLVGEVSKLNQ